VGGRLWYGQWQVRSDGVVSFVCGGCLGPMASAGRSSLPTGAGANLELVDGFCYVGDMLGVVEMLMRLQRPEFGLDGVGSSSWCHCLPMWMYR